MARTSLRLLALLSLLAPLSLPGEGPAPAIQAPLRGEGGEAAAGRHFLWRVERPKGGRLYLLGSVHLGDETLYPLPEPMEAAFREAKVLVVEADVERADPGATQALVLSTGLLKDGSTLQDHLSKRLWAAVQAAAARAGVPLAGLERMRPWLAAVTLMAGILQKEGIDSDHGVERHLLRRARGKKPIAELESVEAQLRLFASLGEREQAAFLAYTLEDVDRLTKETEKLLAAWKSGDTGYMEGLLREIRSKPETRPIYDVMFRDRNRAMTKKLMGYLSTGEVHLVVVGAAHLVGEDGLVAAMRAHGLRVTRL